MKSHEENTLANRIADLRAELGLSQTSFGALVGVKRQAVSNWENAQREPKRNTLLTLADKSGASRSWLLGGEGEMLLPGQGDGAKEEPYYQQETGDPETHIVETGAAKIAQVPLVTINVNGGDGELPFETQVSSYLSFDASQIRNETGVDPRRLVALPVTGNSMRPTLDPGDKAIVARARHEGVQHGAIYVFHKDMMGLMVKRALWQGDDTLLLRSDNREEPVDFEICPHNGAEWTVIGRVVKVIKSL